MRNAIATVILSVLVVGSAVAQQNQAEVDLQSAIRTETVDGDLKAAIQKYESVVAKYKQDRSIAAMALVHMAECYQKLGDTESRKLYERVVREYADQKEAAALARAQLSREGSSATAEMVLHRVWSGPARKYSHISADGRYLLYDVPGKLLVHDLKTGTDRKVLDVPSDQFAEESVMSNDGKLAAYVLFAHDPAPHYDLWVAKMGGNPQPRRLWGDQNVFWMENLAWAPDDKSIVGCLYRTTRDNQIFSVSVADGTMRVVKDIEGRGCGDATFFSPDGRYIAYDASITAGKGKHRVVVLPASGGDEVPAVVEDNNEAIMGWSPDGRNLLFVSDRAGSMSLWDVPFVNGRPTGPPELLKQDIPGNSKGITSSGTLYLRSSEGGTNVELGSFALDGDKLLLRSTAPIKTTIGHNRMPAFSFDGKYLAYRSNPTEKNPGAAIVIQTLATGESRELIPSLNNFDRPKWSPDGRSLLVTGTSLDGKNGVFRIDVQTGQMETMVLTAANAPVNNGGSLQGCGFSRDGSRIYYRSLLDDSTTAYWERDIASGKDREIARSALVESNRLCLLSPDGQFLANETFTRSSRGDRVSELIVVPVAGGEPRKWFQGETGAHVVPAGWAPDSSGLFAWKLQASGSYEGWFVPIATGQPFKLKKEFDFSRAPYVAFHPDGRQVALSTLEDSKTELWALENFLPKQAAARTVGDRAVWNGNKVDGFGTISPDGRYLSYVDWTVTGGLMLHDLNSGIDRRLTAGSYAEGQAEYSAISKDGKQIAYDWLPSGTMKYEVRIASLQGTGIPESRRLFYHDDYQYLAPYDWSPDGKLIAVGGRRTDSTGIIGILSVSDGSLRVLKTVDWKGPVKVFFSPDGKHIAYDVRRDPNNEDEGRNVVVMSLDGAHESKAVDHRSENMVAGWSPDGRYLFFGSNRSGSEALWALAITDGQPHGEPFLVKNHIDAIWSLGLSTTGSMYVWRSGSPEYVRVAGIDLNTGKVTTNIEGASTRFIRSRGWGDWSADGKHFVYEDCTVGGGGPCSVHVQSLQTGKVRDLHPKLQFLFGPHISPDGGSVVTAGRDLMGSPGVFRIDARTGDMARIQLGHNERAIDPQWTADGKEIDYEPQIANTFVIVRHDLVTGEEREIIRAEIEGNNLGFTLSPDEKNVAVISRSSDNRSATLWLVPFAGGKPVPLLRVSSPERLWGARFRDPAWTPDGRAVVVAKFSGPDLEHRELWNVPVDGGKPRKLETAMDNWTEGIALSPDGRHIAFTASSGKQGAEIWALENFLPQANPKR